MSNQSSQISSQERAYLQTMLNQVSRSFALVVPCLEEPLSDYLGTAYLLCRVIDNIEDCGRPFTWQQQRFRELRAMLDEPDRATEILYTWEDEHWPSLNSHEIALMGREQGAMLWAIYASLPPTAQASIARWTREMAIGMEQVEDPKAAPTLKQHNDLRILVDEDAYNHYCFIVAGTVGHMATELVIEQYNLDMHVAERLKEGCESCGRGLQKTNILKDFVEDRARGISYLPETWLAQAAHAPLRLAGAPAEWQYEILNNICTELSRATDYVLDLPLTATGYRIASLLCLLSAYQTILVAARTKDKLFTPEHQIKISRETMAQCINDAQTLAFDNDAVQRYHSAMRDQIERTFLSSPALRVR